MVRFMNMLVVELVPVIRLLVVSGDRECFMMMGLGFALRSRVGLMGSLLWVVWSWFVFEGRKSAFVVR